MLKSYWMRFISHTTLCIQLICIYILQVTCLYKNLPFGSQQSLNCSHHVTFTVCWKCAGGSCTAHTRPKVAFAKTRLCSISLRQQEQMLRVGFQKLLLFPLASISEARWPTSGPRKRRLPTGKGPKVMRCNGVVHTHTIYMWLAWSTCYLNNPLNVYTFLLWSFWWAPTVVVVFSLSSAGQAFSCWKFLRHLNKSGQRKVNKHGISFRIRPCLQPC